MTDNGDTRLLDYIGQIISNLTIINLVNFNSQIKKSTNRKQQKAHPGFNPIKICPAKAP